jgi:NAD(P)-dependent dehydrogenase (short-subunit alcohol dehydrogenase family)
MLVGTAAVIAGIVAARRRATIDLKGKVVLITGGSRGLGLALARGFARGGCDLALCARDPDELRRAQEDLAHFPVRVMTRVCDVSSRTDVDALVEDVLGAYGRIDILVNNAGLIKVGPFDTMTVEDIEEAMGVMFWGPVYTTFAVLPHMRSRGGRIVNITSVGAKMSVPHLVPYSCAKFAAAAFSEGLRSELQGSGVKVVTIAPGLMRTGSHLHATFKGAERGEAGWFSAAASLPGISMGAQRAAEQIIAATRTGRSERILTTQANLAARFHGLFPGITAEILGLVNRLLPHGSQRVEEGWESRTLQRPLMRAVTTLGRKAAVDLLQPGAQATR